MKKETIEEYLNRGGKIKEITKEEEINHREKVFKNRLFFKWSKDPKKKTPPMKIKTDD